MIATPEQLGARNILAGVILAAVAMALIVPALATPLNELPRPHTFALLTSVNLTPGGHGRTLCSVCFHPVLNHLLNYEV